MPRDGGGLSVGLSRPAHRLSHALKELSRQWADTSPYWRDEARSAFQKSVMDELFSSARGGISSMTEVQRLLGQIIQDCG
jgi:hypothetical protein